MIVEWFCLLPFFLLFRPEDKPRVTKFEFVTHQMEERLAEERRFWETIPRSACGRSCSEVQAPRQPLSENPASQVLSTVCTGA